MKPQGILFKGEMVRALLNTRIGDEPGPIDPAKPWKCVTRRLIKPQPAFSVKGVALQKSPTLGKPEIEIEHPRFKVGTTLWVKETFGWLVDDEFSRYTYRADDVHKLDEDPHGWKWKPSLHMPRVASRIDLRVISVRAERLHEITEGDAEKEGVPVCYRVPRCSGIVDNVTHLECSTCCDGRVPQYADLWNSINGPRSWDQNPWAWRIEFRRLK